MSPRYPASFETRPLIGGLPRTNVNTPGFQLSAGLFLFGMGLLMFYAPPPPRGEWTAGMIAGYRAGAWAGAIAGGVLLFCAAQGLARARARALAKAAGAPDAWLLDYDWTPGVCRDRAVAAALEAGFWIVVSAGLAAVALIFLSEEAQGLLFSRVASLGMIGVCALCIYLSAGTVRRGVLFGESVLRWDGGGPLRAGTRWEGSVAVAGSVAAPYAHLQFVKERRHADSENNVSYSRHEHDRVDAAVRVERGAEGRSVARIAVLIPSGAPSTELSRDPARYWELRVADDASGWSTSFLVPVYP